MLSYITPLLRAYIDICRFKRGPQDLPSSPFLLAATTIVYALLQMLIALLDLKLQDAVLLGLLASLLLLVSTTLLLHIVRLGNRWVQTATAFAGTGTVFSIAALPLVIGLAIEDNGQATAMLPRTLWFTLLMWNLAVIAHIWKNALSTNIAVGIALSIAFYYLSFYIIGSVIEFPATEPGAQL
jgi:hypothetical protein